MKAACTSPPSAANVPGTVASTSKALAHSLLKYTVSINESSWPSWLLNAGFSVPSVLSAIHCAMALSAAPVPKSARNNEA